jgi:hypothetical protein
MSRPYSLYVGPVYMGSYYSEWQAKCVNIERFNGRGIVRMDAIKKETSQ